MWKRFFDIASGAGTLWGFLPGTVASSITATLWVVAMAVAGYLQNIPLFWIMMGLPLALAAIFTGLLRFSEWKERITASGKLSFGGVLLGADIVQDEAGKITEIKQAQVRLHLVSRAIFPISYIVDEMQSSLEDHYPPNRPRANNSAIIDNNGEVKWYADNLIDMKGSKANPRISGTTKFKIRYGHPGRERYSMHKDLAFHAAFDQAVGNYVVLGFSEVIS